MSKAMCRGISAAAVAGLIAAASIAAPVTAPTPTLRITHFREYRPASGTMMASATGAAASAPRSETIDLGAPLELAWRIDACHVQTVRITLTGVGEVPPGPRNRERDGCYWLSGRQAVTPATTTEYRLQASGTPAAGAVAAPAPAVASFQVVVRAPTLDVLEPRWDDATLGVTFRARNTGQAEFQPSSITVRYSIHGVQRDGGPALAEGSAVFRNVSIARNAAVELGSVTLADRTRLLSYDSVSISITLHPDYRAPLPDARDSFGHRWTTRSATVTSGLLSVVGRASSLEVRLNNYSPTSPDGYAANDSFVRLNLMGRETRMDFGFPSVPAVLRVVGSLTDHTYIERHYRILVNRITANVQNRDDFLTIRDGKLAIHLEVPNTGNAEVKIGKWESGRFLDDDAPDVNIGPFPVDVLLTPGVSRDGAHVTLASSSVQVPPISADLQGILDELIPKVRETLRTSVHDTVVGQLSGLLARGDVKGAFEDGLGQVTTGLGITRIVNLDARGDRITITYL